MCFFIRVETLYTSISAGTLLATDAF